MLTFTFTYNWDGGGRGVDIFCATGQFANLINVQAGNTFQVNGTTISTEYSPGAVVEVEIAQLAGGIQMNLTRSVSGTNNLTYSTNIVQADAATGVSMYCGGHADARPEVNLVNYAIFMNDLKIVGVLPDTLTFISGTWDPSAVGLYPFTLQRSGNVTDLIVLTSENPAAVTVPPTVTFAAGSNTVTFDVAVVSLTNGEARIVASNAASGVATDYVIKPYKPANPPIPSFVYNPATDGLSFTIPAGYSLVRVEGATMLVGQAWNWPCPPPPTMKKWAAWLPSRRAAAKRMIRIVLAEIPTP